MWKTRLTYKHPWNKVVNIVCLDSDNIHVQLLAAYLQLQHVDYDICVIDRTIKENMWYDGRVELVLLGCDDLFDLENNKSASIVPQSAACNFVKMQKPYQLIDSGVDFAAASNLRDMWMCCRLLMQRISNRAKNTSNDMYLNVDEMYSLRALVTPLHESMILYEKRAKEIFALYC